MASRISETSMRTPEEVSRGPASITQTVPTTVPSASRIDSIARSRELDQPPGRRTAKR